MLDFVSARLPLYHRHVSLSEHVALRCRHVHLGFVTRISYVQGETADVLRVGVLHTLRLKLRCQSTEHASPARAELPTILNFP